MSNFWIDFGKEQLGDTDMVDIINELNEKRSIRKLEKSLQGVTIYFDDNGVTELGKGDTTFANFIHGIGYSLKRIFPFFG